MLYLKSVVDLCARVTNEAEVMTARYHDAAARKKILKKQIERVRLAWAKTVSMLSCEVVP